jgi:serine protease Do
LNDLPVAGKPTELPWIGVPQMAGLTKDVSEVYGLADQPAVQIGDIIPDSPAAKAGLKQGDIVVKVNGEALERGDESDELPILLRRRLLRMKSGDTVTLSVIRKRNAPPEDIKIKMETQPKQMNLAERFYADDLGFGVREMVFMDTYSRRLPADAKGVVVSVIKPQSNAQSGGLQGNSSPRSDVIISLNGEPVTDIKQFKERYKQVRKDKPKEPVVLVVRREGREDTVRIEPPQ